MRSIQNLINDFRWENGLPLRGDIYDRAVEHLLSMRIREECNAIGADAMGREIRQTILKPFRWNASAFKTSTSPDVLHVGMEQAQGQSNEESVLVEPQYSNYLTSGTYTSEKIAPSLTIRRHGIDGIALYSSDHVIYW